MDPAAREHMRRLDELSRVIKTGHGLAVLRDAIGHIDFQSVEIERLRRRIHVLEAELDNLRLTPERV